MHKSFIKAIIGVLIFTLVAMPLKSETFTGEYVDEEMVLKDLSGNRHIINQYLDDGISVILNFSSTWCKPCWNYEQRGILDVVYNAFGPNGSNQVVVLLLEADPRTSEGCMYGQQDCNDFSYGDWTKKSYPTISLPQKYLFLNKTYKVTHFPSIIGISSKDKSIHNIGQINLNEWKNWILEQYEPLVQSPIRPVSYLKSSPISVESRLEIIRRAVIDKNTSDDTIAEEGSVIKVGVFPNPCAETVHINIPEDCNGAMVSFFNERGQELKYNLPKYIPPGVSKISIKHLRKGLYSLKVKGRDFTASNRFIVLQ